MAKLYLTIDHTKVSANLTDFPVYVNLNDVKPGMTQNEADSIRVYKADGVTELPREIVSASEMHFLADDLSNTADTTFILDIDGTSSDYAVDSTYGAQSVWDSNYVAVWHLDDMHDSTSNGNTLTDVGTSSVAGKLAGNGRSFDASGADMLKINSVPTSNPLNTSSQMTLEVWAYHLSFANQFPRLIERADSGNGANGYSVWYLAGPQLYMDTNYLGNGYSYYTPSGNGPAANTWTHIVSRIDSNYDIFLNGVKQSGTYRKQVNPVPPAKVTDFVLGNSTWSARNFNGYEDEVRVSKITRSDSWIATEYNNQNDTSSFYKIVDRAQAFMTFF